MDTKFYIENDWHISHCSEHNEENKSNNWNPVWIYSDGLYWSEYSLTNPTRIVHASYWSGGSNEPTWCNCNIYEIERDNTYLYLVGNDGVIASEGVAYRIINGPKGTKNKYLVVYTNKNTTSYDRADWNVVSLGKFQDHGTFLTEEEALEFSNDLLNRKIGKCNEQIIMNLNKLLKIRCPDCGYYPGERSTHRSPMK